MKENILIFDDETGAAESWKQRLDTARVLPADTKVVPVGHEDFRKGLRGLEKRRQEARNGKPFSEPLGENDFDGAKILIVDFDLLYLGGSDESGGSEDYITGEAVAYLARSYSECGFIIALNQFGIAPGFDEFDLTLRGHPESFADLNIGSEQIANRGLWTDERTGFRPWSWPLLLLESERFERRVDALKESLDHPILPWLTFTPDIIRSFPRATLEFIDCGKTIEETTFREFVTQSGNGLRGKDARTGANASPLTDEAIARIAAARVGKWLERAVISGQDILVDAPHLVSRYPSLMSSKGTEVEKLNTTTSLISPAINEALIRDYKFTLEDWTTRPVWWWRLISRDEHIDEVANPWDVPQSEYAFCEDVSKFLPTEEAREFASDLPSQFSRRFVVSPETCTDEALVEILQRIDYRPQVQFAL